MRTVKRAISGGVRERVTTRGSPRLLGGKSKRQKSRETNNNKNKKGGL